MNHVKSNILNNGAAACYIDMDEEAETHAFGEHMDDLQLKEYYWKSKNPNDSQNHAVAVVGWNDNARKENFVRETSDGEKIEPAGDGAWLVKNTACWAPTSATSSRASTRWSSSSSRKIGRAHV